MCQELAVKIHGVDKRFLRKDLFKKLSFNLYKGRVTGIVGQNGSGKTTLLKLICGLILPDDGTIEVFGCNILKYRSRIMPRIGVVLEGSRNLYWRLSAWQNLVYFSGLRGVFGGALRKNGEALLKELNLWNAKDELTQNFSRGMQQKLAVICAFISEPDLLILDEPMLALDSLSKEVIEQWIKKITQEKRKTVVITSHQSQMLEQLCQRIVSLSAGLTSEVMLKE